jgi:hypothetical protein
MKYRINHPKADTISVVKEVFGMPAYAGKNTSEIAFFLNGEWVVNPIEPFAEYHDGGPSDAPSAVYLYVPDELIDAFLAENGI